MLGYRIIKKDRNKTAKPGSQFGDGDPALLIMNRSTEGKGHAVSTGMVANLTPASTISILMVIGEVAEW